CEGQREVLASGLALDPRVSAPASSGQSPCLLQSSARLRRPDRERQGSVGRANREVQLRQHPGAFGIGAWAQVELRCVVREGLWMARQERLVPFTRQEDLASAARRLASASMEDTEGR